MSSQLIIFLLFFGGLQGLLFFLFLVRKRLYSKGYIFLLLYLGVLLLQLTLKIMSKIWLMHNWSTFYQFSHFLPLLYGPLVYLFVKYAVASQPFMKKEWLHFIPAAIVLLLLFPAVNNSLPTNFFANVLFTPYVRLVLLTTSVISYSVMAYRLWKQHRNHVPEYFSVNDNLQLNWIRKFIYMSAFTGIAVSLSLFLLFITYPYTHQYRYGFAVLSIFIYWISYTALTTPSVFSFIRGNSRNTETTPYSLPALKILKQTPKYANSNLSEEDEVEICSRLDKIMATEKLYLQPGLGMMQVAEALHCTRHHLSQVINNKLQLTFNDYINNLRLQQAKQLLLDDKKSGLKIAAIAYDAGFNSLSTFNEVFKKHTGKTPSDFRKESLKELQKQRV
jgi:AraC-like DNA-binding protein